MANGTVLDGLMELPDDEPVDTSDLARALGRGRKAVQRAVRRGELPPPFRWGGRNCWRVGTIREHLRKMQDEALREARKRNLGRSSE